MFLGYEDVPVVSLPSKPEVHREPETKEEILEKYRQVSDERFKRVMNLEQHLNGDGPANPLWLAERVGVITGSKISGVLNHGFENPDSLLKSMLWPGSNYINKVYTSHGNKYEECAELCMAEMFQRRKEDPNDPLVDFNLYNAGLILSREEFYGFQGYSPDGIVEMWIRNSDNEIEKVVHLTEYKCPYSRKDYPHDFEGFLYGPMSLPKRHLDNQKKLRNPNYHASKKKQLGITSYYFDQVNYGMGLLSSDSCGILTKNPKCFFLVWTFGPVQMFVVDYDPDYYQYQKQMAHDFWHNRYVPARVLQSQNRLAYGEIEESDELVL